MAGRPGVLPETTLPPLLDHVQTRLQPSPRQARSRAKVSALLAAAERLFVERGYESVTADAIAAAAGVSTGTFYRYFGDKRDALMVLLAHHVEELMGLTPPEMPAGATPRALVRAGVARAITRGQDPRLQRLRQIWFLAARRDPELAAYERLLATEVAGRIRGRLEQAARLGLTQPIDAEATAWAIWTLVDALGVRLAVIGSAMPSPERLIEATTDLICRAVFVPLDTEL
jgi:AcrR family transcriptional regulator